MDYPNHHVTHVYNFYGKDLAQRAEEICGFDVSGRSDNHWSLWSILRSQMDYILEVNNRMGQGDCWAKYSASTKELMSVFSTVESLGLDSLDRHEQVRILNNNHTLIHELIKAHGLAGEALTHLLAMRDRVHRAQQPLTEAQVIGNAGASFLPSSS